MKKIGIDIDEVLASFVEGLFDYHNKTRGTHFDKKDITSNFFSDYAGLSKEETNAFLDEFFNSDNNQNIETVEGAREAIKMLKGDELFAITIRPEHWRRQTEEWIGVQFGKVFNDVYMLGVEASSEGGVTQTKEELSVELALDVFVEDSLSTAKKISEKGIPVILLDKKWNQGEVSKGVYRVADWRAALAQIESV